VPRVPFERISLIPVARKTQPCFELYELHMTRARKMTSGSVFVPGMSTLAYPSKCKQSAISDNDFSWLQNFVPIGPGEMRMLWPNGTSFFISIGGKTIVCYHATVQEGPCLHLAAPTPLMRTAGHSLQQDASLRAQFIALKQASGVASTGATVRSA
jgi:hypothetical protein